MKPFDITQLKNMKDVTRYWQTCLADADKAPNDMIVAGWMTGVITLDQCDNEWYEGRASHPAFGPITDLVANLETPITYTDEQRQKAWKCVRALVSVLEQYYLEG
jgi:hypothetical protein